LEENNKNLLLVGTSPHIVSGDSTRGIMGDVLIALCPALIAGIYFFGWRVLTLTVFSCGACIALEWLYELLLKKEVTVTDLSAVVTGVLMVFVLPASVPYWMLFLGDFFAIVVVKQLFGGLGKNFMNPALAGRIFLTGFATLLNTNTAISTSDDYAALPIFSNPKLINGVPDVVTSATPLAGMKANALPDISIFEMFLGLKSGTVGEISGVLLVLGGLYLLLRKVITLRIPVGYIGTVALLSLLSAPADQNAFTWMLYSVLAGGLLLGAIYMATDYSTSPVTPGAQWVYACGCGLLTWVIRRFGAYNEGVAYSILIMNATVWLLDKYIRPTPFGYGKKVKEKAAAVMAQIQGKEGETK